MIIGDKSSAAISNLYVRSVQPTESKSRAVDSASDAAQAPDEVGISTEALARQKAADAATSSDDVRWDKVGQLRQQIANGTYKVSASDVASRLIADA